MKAKTLFWVIWCLLVFSQSLTYSQTSGTYIRQGNKAFEKADYQEASRLYRESLKKKPDLTEGLFNLGNALYRQGKFDSTRTNWQKVIESTPRQDIKSQAWHNIGNSYLSERKPREAIEAYKNALKLNPQDEETRHNLAYALRLLPPPQQQNQNKDHKNDQEKNKNQSGNSSQSNKNQENKSNNPTRPQENLTREEAEKLLQALMNKEQQDKTNKEKKERFSVSPSGKDW